MNQIWKPIQEKYKIYEDIAEKLSDIELYNLITKKVRMVFYQYPKSNLNLLSTCGCSHFYNNGSFAGCSMCNYHCNDIEGAASLRVLRHKNVNLYAKIVKESFLNVRGYINEQMGDELVTGHDIFCDEEFPEQVMQNLFSIDPIYKVRPFIFSFEARANNFTYKKMKSIIENVGKGRIVAECGVETSNEWLRNHWLNKNIKNEDIDNAMALCKEFSVRFKADVIFGLPGLSEQNSIDVFCDTIKWLCLKNCDYITILPLNRKKYTFQQYIYNALSDNKKLIKHGISYKQHTGLPWLYSFVKALVKCFDEIEGVEKKISIGQYSTNLNSVESELAYNEDPDCVCIDSFRQTMILFNETKDKKLIYNLWEKMRQDTCYSFYQDILELQQQVSGVASNIHLVGEEVVKSLFPNNSVLLNQFYKELEQL